MAPNLLYKCIPFTKSYWPYIVTEQAVRFASIPELWNGNDSEEFIHRWDTKSRFFGNYGHHLVSRFDSLFSKKRQSA